MSKTYPTVAVGALAVAAGLLIAQGATAQTPTEESPFATTSPAAEAALAAPDPAAQPASAATKLSIPSPRLKAGDKLVYKVVSTVQTSGPMGAQTRANEQTIQLEVLPAKGKTLLLQYVIVDGDVKDDPIGNAMLAASRGVLTAVEIDSTGKPLRLPEWSKVRASILERLLLDPAAPLDGAKRARASLTSMDEVSSVPFAVPELLMLADMQAWKEVVPGRTEDAPTQSGGPAPGRYTHVRDATGPAEGACTVQLRRGTELDPQSPLAKTRGAAEKIETTADVSTVDGWVVNLRQTSNRLVGSSRMIRSWTITRVDPPACPGAGEPSLAPTPPDA